MDTITIEQACDPANWRWKKWDVRSDGRIFWQYSKKSPNGQYWVCWEQALKLRKAEKNSIKKYQENKGKIWKAENKKRIKQYTEKFKIKRKYSKKYPIFIMSERVRSRIRSFIKERKYTKTSKTKDMLGCTWEELRCHMESKFLDGMSWANRSMWHIDHITPLASAKSVEEVVKLCHYTNLQPLWAEDNMRKGASVS